MIGYRVKLNTSQVVRFLRNEIPTAYKAATSRGMNKSILQVRTQAIRAVRQVRNLQARVVRDAMKVKRATRNKLTAVLEGSGRAIALKHYGARVVGRRGRGNRTVRNAPVQVEIVKGQKKIVEGGFLGRTGQVLARAGPQRLPVRVLVGPSIPTAMERDDVVHVMQSVAESRTPPLIEHEMAREFHAAQLRAAR